MNPESNRILVMGFMKAGKTSLISRIREVEFDPNVRPTLGIQIHRLLIEQSKFEVYDLGGQERLREKWYDKSFKPKGIIYVLDCSSDKENLNKNRAEFARIIDFYYKDLSGEMLKKIPLLLLGNKIDLLTTEYKYILQDLFFDIKKGLNYHIGYCSAKDNIGVKDNFHWIIGEIVKYS